MSKMLKLSIDLTKLGEMSRAEHDAISTSQSNGKQYLNATVWINDENDQYGNIGSVQVWNKTTNEKSYVGNLREFDKSKDTQSDTNQGEKPLPF